MKMSQAKIIENLVYSSKEPVPSWGLQKINTEWGWLGPSADRIARKLAEDGVLNRVRRGKYVYYTHGDKQLGFDWK